LQHISGLSELSGQTQVGQIAGDGDVVRGGRLQVMEQSIEHLSAVLSTSSQVPLEIPIYSLVEKFSYLDII
jgi:myosin-crossreactive antigen